MEYNAPPHVRFESAFKGLLVCTRVDAEDTCIEKHAALNERSSVSRDFVSDAYRSLFLHPTS